MRYVIIRDDDTNALTPADCLERLYRPFLDRELPVNLAVIPDVAIDTRLPDGGLEGFLSATAGKPVPPAMAFHFRNRMARPVPPGSSRGAVAVAEPEVESETRPTRPIASNVQLVRYLHENPSFRIVQHGCYHDYFEFDRSDPDEVEDRIEHGARTLVDAGFPRPQTFVAPYDKLSRASLHVVARRFRVLSTGWFELRRLPRTWWPQYVVKKFRGSPHWQVGRTTLLTHPGCLLSYHRPYETMLERIIQVIESQALTVLVTHWWEYFRDGQADEAFIRVLHQTAEYLASRRDIRVISFADIAEGRASLQ